MSLKTYVPVANNFKGPGQSPNSLPYTPIPPNISLHPSAHANGLLGRQALIPSPLAQTPLSHPPAGLPAPIHQTPLEQHAAPNLPPHQCLNAAPDLLQSHAPLSPRVDPSSPLPPISSLPEAAPHLQPPPYPLAMAVPVSAGLYPHLMGRSGAIAAGPALGAASCSSAMPYQQHPAVPRQSMQQQTSSVHVLLHGTPGVQHLQHAPQGHYLLSTGASGNPPTLSPGHHPTAAVSTGFHIPSSAAATPLNTPPVSGPVPAAAFQRLPSMDEGSNPAALNLPAQHGYMDIRSVMAFQEQLRIQAQQADVQSVETAALVADWRRNQQVLWDTALPSVAGALPLAPRAPGTSFLTRQGLNAAHGTYSTPELHSPPTFDQSSAEQHPLSYQERYQQVFAQGPVGLPPPYPSGSASTPDLALQLSSGGVILQQQSNPELFTPAPRFLPADQKDPRLPWTEFATAGMVQPGHLDRAASGSGSSSGWAGSGQASPDSYVHSTPTQVGVLVQGHSSVSVTQNLGSSDSIASRAKQLLAAGRTPYPGNTAEQPMGLGGSSSLDENENLTANGSGTLVATSSAEPREGQDNVRQDDTVDLPKDNIQAVLQVHRHMVDDTAVAALGEQVAAAVIDPSAEGVYQEITEHDTGEDNEMERSTASTLDGTKGYVVGGAECDTADVPNANVTAVVAPLSADDNRCSETLPGYTPRADGSLGTTALATGTDDRERTPVEDTGSRPLPTSTASASASDTQPVHSNATTVANENSPDSSAVDQQQLSRALSPAGPSPKADEAHSSLQRDSSTGSRSSATSASASVGQGRLSSRLRLTGRSLSSTGSVGGTGSTSLNRDWWLNTDGIHLAGVSRFTALSGLSVIQTQLGASKPHQEPDSNLWRREIEEKAAGRLLLREYDSVPRRRTKYNCQTALHLENQQRNAPGVKVLPYEENRVCLKPTKSNKTGYINASHIKYKLDPNGPTESSYMIGQTPLQCSLVDFWQCVWEHAVDIIVFISDTEDCAPYWPKDGDAPMIHGTFTISLQASTPSESHTTSSLSLKHADQTRAIWHLHYTRWQDTTDKVDDFVAFLNEFNSLKLLCSTNAPSSPDHRHPAHNPTVPSSSAAGRHHHGDQGSTCKTLITCSSGAGASAVFLLARVAMETHELNRPIRLRETLAELRPQRMQLVDTLAAYLVLYKTVLKHLTCSRLI